MKKLSVVFLAVAMQVAVAAPSPKVAGSANNNFGFELFNNTVKRTDKGNKFLSPVSAYLALSMLYGGARTHSEKEMADGLYLTGLSQADVLDMNHNFGHALEGDEDYTLKIANSAWTNKGYDLTKDFKRVIGNYHARAASLDFSLPSTLTAINKWVQDATFDETLKKPLIEEILKEIPPEAAFYLLNAVYFKADWENKFSWGESRNRDFFVTANKKVQVPTMSQTGHYRLASADTYDSIELPYKGGKTSMVVILPKVGKTADAVAAKFNDQAWAKLTAALDKAEPQSVDVELPKLELKYDDELNVALQKKMGSIFDKGKTKGEERADLTGISVSKDHLFVNRVLQKTFLSVDEDGTTAAAVTAVEGFAESAVFQEPPKFHVNRPYLLAIREKSTNAILFLGGINEPEGGKLTEKKKE